MHQEHGHFAKICKRIFWHRRTEQVHSVVSSCKECQLLKHTESIRSDFEELKSIEPMSDLY
jgi:hypothetical protein